MHVVLSRQALALHGRGLGSLPLHVERSTTAMHHIVTSLLPKTLEDQERCIKTVHITSIDVAAEEKASTNQFCCRFVSSQCLASYVLCLEGTESSV